MLSKWDVTQIQGSFSIHKYSQYSHESHQQEKKKSNDQLNKAKKFDKIKNALMIKEKLSK